MEQIRSMYQLASLVAVDSLPAASINENIHVSAFLNQETITLFNKLYDKIFAQHRWENNKPNYHGPKVIVDRERLGKKVASVEIEPGDPQTLFSAGGGKDSIVSMKLLERGSFDYGTFQYAHSVYGDIERQHKLICNSLSASRPKRSHQLNVEEDFFNSPILQNFGGEITTLCNPETPNGVFQALPYILQYGYQYLSVGHEKSADHGNFFWEEINQEVNHQWGKSFEAEKLLNEYIKRNICHNFTFFSILKPLYDLTIFQLLKKDERLIRLTSSCNIKKPYCLRCPKCAYVWLNFMAYLDNDIVKDIFEENLFDVPELYEVFMEMMGLKGHKPFECIGEIGETRLAMYVCLTKGLQGKVLDTFRKTIYESENFELLIKKYNVIDKKNHKIPTFMASQIFSQFEKARVNSLDELVVRSKS